MNIAISSKALATLKSLISSERDIVGLEVKGKYLYALLDNGLYFGVLNI